MVSEDSKSGLYHLIFSNYLYLVIFRKNWLNFSTRFTMADDYGSTPTTDADNTSQNQSETSDSNLDESASSFTSEDIMEGAQVSEIPFFDMDPRNNGPTAIRKKYIGDRGN